MKKFAKVLSIVFLSCYAFTAMADPKTESSTKTAPQDNEEPGLIIPTNSFTKGIKFGGKVSAKHKSIMRFDDGRSTEVKYPSVTGMIDATASIPVGDNTIEVRVAPKMSFKEGEDGSQGNAFHPSLAHAYADIMMGNGKVRTGYTDTTFGTEEMRAFQLKWMHDINDNFNYGIGLETTNVMDPDGGKDFRGVPGVVQSIQYTNDRFDVQLLGLERLDINKEKNGKKTSKKMKFGAGGKLLTDVIIMPDYLKLKTEITGGRLMGDYINSFVEPTDNSMYGELTVETYFIPEKLQCDLSYGYTTGGEKFKMFKKQSEGGWGKKHSASLGLYYHFVHKKVKLGLSGGFDRMPASATDKKAKAKNDFPVSISAKYEF